MQNMEILHFRGPYFRPYLHKNINSETTLSWLYIDEKMCFHRVTNFGKEIPIGHISCGQIYVNVISHKYE